MVVKKETFPGSGIYEEIKHLDVSDLQSTVIPFVGTLNDDNPAIPMFELDKNGEGKIELQESPLVATRKQKASHYLRKLSKRYLEKQPLLLCIFVITRDRRPIDNTNVANLIQNSGNRNIWSDDCQFSYVSIQRIIYEWLKPEAERTIVYVKEIPQKYMNNDKYPSGQHAKIFYDYRKFYDEQRDLELTFNPYEREKYENEGFWEDERFLDISALEVNYQEWLLKKES